jgi:hypothetical protein
LGALETFETTWNGVADLPVRRTSYTESLTLAEMIEQGGLSYEFLTSKLGLLMDGPHLYGGWMKVRAFPGYIRLTNHKDLE